MTTQCSFCDYAGISPRATSCPKCGANVVSLAGPSQAVLNERLGRRVRDWIDGFKYANTYVGRSELIEFLETLLDLPTRIGQSALSAMSPLSYSRPIPSNALDYVWDKMRFRILLAGILDVLREEHKAADRVESARARQL